MNITFAIASGVLFSAGGYNFLFARRWMMPILLTLFAAYVTRDLWSITMLSACGSLSLGYGEKAPLRHVFGDCWGRGIWGLLVAACLSTGLMIAGHLSVVNYIGYLVLGFFLEPIFKNLPQMYGDAIIGAGFGLIAFLMH